MRETVGIALSIAEWPSTGSVNGEGDRREEAGVEVKKPAFLGMRFAPKALVFKM